MIYIIYNQILRAKEQGEIKTKKLIYYIKVETILAIYIII